MTVPLAAAYYENDRGRGECHDDKAYGDPALLELVREMRKELSSLRHEVKELRGVQGKGQGQHDRRSFFEKNFVDRRHDRGRGERGK